MLRNPSFSIQNQPFFAANVCPLKINQSVRFGNRLCFRFVFFLFSIWILTGCDTPEPIWPPLSEKGKILAGDGVKTWKVTAVFRANLPDSLPCRWDDEHIFRADSVYIYRNGPQFCDSSEAQGFTGKWRLLEDPYRLMLTDLPNPTTFPLRCLADSLLIFQLNENNEPVEWWLEPKK